MMDLILFFAHHTLNLLWGVLASAAFCGVRFYKRNILLLSAVFAGCGLLQLGTFLIAPSEQFVWEVYPLIVHLPLSIALCLLFKKRPITVVAGVALAYLCCQPSKWCGLLTEVFTTDSTIVWCVKILVAAAVIWAIIRYFSNSIANLFNKDARSVMIFGSLPVFYYVFDYIVGVYTDLWTDYYRLSAEFLAFTLCVFFIAFCILYYKEYERKIEAEHKEQIIRIAAEQQAKEIETIQKSNLETSLLRHDMRLILSTVALCINQNDTQQALKTISGYVNQVEAAAVKRYCGNATLNYILTNFAGKCEEQGIHFQPNVELAELPVDEIPFASIISNALDNAINAQLSIPESDRQIRLMLKASNGKLLLSVKNPFVETPIFVDGIPTSNRKGHGYGTQSIRYMTERLGGKYRFSLHDNWFVLRVVI